MSLTPPKGNIPIGSVDVAGRRLPVTIDAEWLRYLTQGLLARVGGTSGDDLTAVNAVASEAMARTHLAQPMAAQPIDVGQLLGSVQSFLPRPAQQRSVDDAQLVIANKVFSR